MEETAMVSQLQEALRPEQVLSGSAVHRAYDCDAYTVDRFPPSCVVLPESTEEVRRVVQWCRSNDVPYTPRGAGTGLSGGAMPALGGVVLCTKKMTKILQMDVADRCAHVESGVVNSRLSEAARPFGLHFAPDPSSQTVCTLGGNINENSGGPHTLKYGVTSHHVLQVTLVDPQGNVQDVGSRVPGGPGLDVLSLVVGSEGTLGVVTEAWVKLTPLPQVVRTALVSFTTIDGATRAVGSVITGGVVPAALEMMDRNVLVALRAAFGLTFPEGTAALLLIECDGDDEAVDSDLARALDACRQHGVLDVQTAQNEAERARLWTARKKGIGAMGRLAPTIVTHDGVIPRSKLPEMLQFVGEVAREAGVGVANLFHAGDGNLHPCFYFDDREPGVVDKVVSAGERILEKCLELGGSVTGEHGVGVEKSTVWGRSLSPADLALQQAVRIVFQTDSLCNPCKVLPDQKGCVEHMRRWRGAAT